MTLSAFVKKLLFARQFNIDEGEINLLGRRKVMFDPDFVNKIKDKNMIYALSKDIMRENANYFREHMGITGDRLLDFSLHLMETYGYGSIKVINIDKGKKTASLAVHSSPFGKESTPVAGSIAGVLSVVFNSDVDVHETAFQTAGDICKFEVKGKA